MKRFLYSFIALAGLLAVAACEKEEKVIFDPENATAPTLGEVTGGPSDGVLSATGTEDIVFSFTKADYGFTAATTYSLNVSDSEDFGTSARVTTTVDEDNLTITVTQANLNTALLALGYEADTEVTAYFMLTSSVITMQSASISGTELSSNVVSGTFTTYDSDVLDQDLYNYLYYIGDFNGWSFDNPQYLFNYSGDGTTYEGTVDFGSSASNGWKMTANTDWSGGNYGTGGDYTYTDEASSITLLNDGSSGNITCYSKRFYYFSFDTGTCVLTKNWGIDTFSIVGSFNGWSGGEDMEYNTSTHQFYIDIEFTESVEFKFYGDYTWGTAEYGQTDGVFVSGGSNISAEAGTYRIYVDINKGTYELNSSMYGQEEPGYTEPTEPTDPTAWSIIGTIGGSNWDTDYDLTNTEGDIWVYTGLEVTADDEFKIRADHAWSTSYGGPEANSTSTIDANNVYDVYKPTLGEAFSTGGYNIQIGTAGTYNVTLDYANSTILIEAQ